MKKLSVLFLVIMLVLGFSGVFSQADSESILAARKGWSVPKFVPNEVIIQFNADVHETEKIDALSRVGAALRERLVDGEWAMIVDSFAKSGPALRQGDVELASLPAGMSVLDAISKLQGHLAVKYAEPNWIYTHDATSNDPYYTDGSLWGMYGDTTNPTNQYGSQAGEAWARGNIGSKPIYIGVIDEGIMINHTDLSVNIWTNPYDPVDGIDNDGNGYIDDKNGWDFNRNDNTVYDGTSDDHGTHVAGTIGAVGGNGEGVAGVCWNVTLISAKFLGPSGGTTANAIKTVDYITDLKTRHGLNIVATNNSWSGGGYSQGLYDAIERANAANILFIAAAGNGGNDFVGDDNDQTPSYPSSYTNTNIIAVAAIKSDGTKSSFSNYGATSVDLGAPGSGIYSTLPGKGRNPSGYGSYSGTSMATPHVTGGAALYAATHPGATAAQIKSVILNSTTPTLSLTGKCVTGGRLNVSGF